MAECNPTNFLTCSVDNAVQGAVKSGTSSLAEDMMAGYDKILKDFMTSWLGKGIMVNLDGISADWFRLSTSNVTLFLVTMGLIVAGIQTFRQTNGRPMREVLESLGKVVFVSTAGVMAVQAFVIAGDWFGKWILASAGLDTGSFVVTSAAIMGAPGLAVVLGFLGIMTVLCQWGLMFLRGAILPALTGWWQISAAGAMLEGGKKGFEILTSWILAFVIYSPVAACIYALAWRMKNGDEGVGGVVNGWILIVLAVLALPAILRLIAPVSSALGRMAGGSMAIGMTAAAVSAGVAVGAAVATGGASAAGGAAAGGGAAGTAGTAGAAGSAGTAGGGAAKGAEGAAGGSGTSGGSGADGQGGKHAASGSDGNNGGAGQSGGSSSGGSGSSSAAGGASESSGSGGQSGGSSSSESSAASGASESSSGSGQGGGSGVGWQAAQGALESNQGSGNAAEGALTE